MYKCFTVETNIGIKGEKIMMEKLEDRQVTRFDLYFLDGQRVVINKLIDYDIDLYRSEKSCIEITTCNNSELFNRFCNNTDGVIKIQCTVQGKEIVDIMCNMHIENLMLNGSFDVASEMRVKLEGMVK
jgi:hypothetical protein